MKKAAIAIGVLLLAATVDAQTISTGKTSYNVGDPVTVSFSVVTPTPKDYVAIVTAGGPEGVWPGAIVGGTAWDYTSGSQTAGTTGVKSGSLKFVQALGAGNYEARLYLNDAVTSVAKATFSVAVPLVQVTGPATLKWTQTAPDLATAQAYIYVVQADTGNTTLSATCSGAASPFPCNALLPTYPVGQHSLTLTAANGAGPSLPSAPLSFAVVLMVPSVPTGLIIQ